MLKNGTNPNPCVESLWEGTPISVPGVYRGVPIEAYHEQLTIDPSISSSGLRTIANKSPLHYWATSYLNKNRTQAEDTKALSLGSAVHSLLLDDGEYSKFAVRPEGYQDATGAWKSWNSNASACKEWTANQKAAGKTVVRQEDIDVLTGMAGRISEDKHVASLLRGRIERSIVLKDKTGVWIKSRPDCIPDDNIVVDLKTCSDASEQSIRRSILNYGYLQQMALAVSAMEDICLTKVDHAVLVFVETSYPYAINIKPLDNSDIYTAMRLNRRAIDIFAECLKTQKWPSYPNSRITWTAPAWWTDHHERDGSLPEIKDGAYFREARGALDF